jgi:hypothetical protein
MSIWTLVAALQPGFVLGLTATLRPRHESQIAHMCGLNEWSRCVRASCERPAVKASMTVYDDEGAAIMALIDFKPQLVRMFLFVLQAR